MIKDKESYFNELAYLETAELFLTEETNQINQEIYHNVIYISLSSDIAKQISLEEIQVFLNKVKLNQVKRI